VWSWEVIADGGDALQMRLSQSRREENERIRADYEKIKQEFDFCSCCCHYFCNQSKFLQQEKEKQQSLTIVYSKRLERIFFRLKKKSSVEQLEAVFVQNN